ncbi:Polyadenylate-binding protein RBP47 [Camellia lanceoleosa]|uniref:Polyadenylate-binding protein RBP47 n=1 Tax=Camellia lanceoleosa TaxID=1840588 RepID=A0ACC0HLN3_9ERIC|nr:Polyadenylate-binding protein RBP47 [Camellia lanceoleosa]
MDGRKLRQQLLRSHRRGFLCKGYYLISRLVSQRYGFIEFVSHAAAEKVLQSFNGTIMPNTEQTFRLNWAGFSTGDRRVDAGSDLSVFVGDLAADVTDAVLHETFASRYPSVKGAKVVVDSNTGRSKLRMDSNNQVNGAYYGRAGLWRLWICRASESGSSMYAASGTYGAASNGYGNHQQPVS